MTDYTACLDSQIEMYPNRKCGTYMSISIQQCKPLEYQASDMLKNQSQIIKVGVTTFKK